MVDYADGEYHIKRRSELLENQTLRLREPVMVSRPCEGMSV
jgi:hypothetical protein